MEVLAESDSRSDDGTQVEDRPEDGDEATLLALSRVTHHEGTLCGPEQTGTNTEDGAGGDDEAANVRVHVRSTGEHPESQSE